jgi:hypothetical protein
MNSFTAVSTKRFFGLVNTGNRSEVFNRIKLKNSNNPSHINKYGSNIIPTEGNTIPPIIEIKIATLRKKNVLLPEFSLTIMHIRI